MTGSAQDQVALDDAHLQSLGIKPELRRTLGFLSNFAIAFSFISVSTGSFGNFGVGIGLGGPAFFWSWPIVIFGQTLVALVTSRSPARSISGRSGCRTGRLAGSRVGSTSGRRS